MIYEHVGAERYEGVNCVEEDDFSLFSAFDGSSHAASWQPLKVERYSSGRRRPDRPADLPWYGNEALVMRARAVDALSDMLEAGGEILPLATDDGVELWALNVTRMIDALDEEHSILWRLDSGKLIFITAPAFHEPLVRDVDFFKLPNYTKEIFFGECFIERVRAARLTGLKFNPVWSAEGGPIKRRLW